MKGIIEAIANKQKLLGGCLLHPPATLNEIAEFESQLGFELPPDFVEFYSICNGFECTDDIFTMIPLQNVLRHKNDFGKNWLHFAEYMIYSDMWSLKKLTDNQYLIINRGENEIGLTSSLTEFLQRFLQGGVFEKGGLYDWHEEIKLT